MNLEVREIQVFFNNQALTPAFSYTFRRGFLYVLMGESGLGKSLFLQAISNCLEPNLSFKGSFNLAHSDLVYVFQDASTGLNSAKPLQFYIDEICSLNDISKSRLNDYLVQLNLSADLLKAYSFNLSGGQKQRFSILLALLSNKKWILLDEVNSGLDSENTLLLLNIIKREITEYMRSVIWVTHFNAEILKQADFILKIIDNKIIEQNYLDSPKKYVLTEKLSDGNNLISIKNLSFSYNTSSFSLSEVSLEIGESEKLLLTGESGSGKSTLGKILATYIKLENDNLEFKIATTKIQYIHQDSFESFPPHLKVWEAVSDPAYYNGIISNRQRKTKVLDWFQKFDLAEDLMYKNVQQCSGGQRQRLAIIRALLMEPELLICDEITANLDTELATKVLRVLDKLNKEKKLSLVYITHRLEDLNIRFHSHYHLHNGRLKLVDNG